jgi:hypothetical protein
MNQHVTMSMAVLCVVADGTTFATTSLAFGLNSELSDHQCASPLAASPGVLYTFSLAKSLIFPSLRHIVTPPYLKPFPYMGIQSSAN